MNTAVRTIDEVEVPVTNVFSVDGSHTHVGFSVRHLGLSKVRGTFNEVEAEVVVAEDPLQSTVTAKISTASLDTKDETRDGHVRSADFLNVEEHPYMEYRSTSVSRTGSDDYVVDGELTVAGVTKPVKLEVEFDGAMIDPWGNPRFGFSAKTEINREDFGLTWNQALETGGFVVGKKVSIEIEGEAVAAS